MATAFESTTTDGAWIDFCERHAQAAAQDFSKSCMQYMNMNLPESIKSTITHKEFLKKFMESFTEQFEMDFNRRRMNNTKISNGLGTRNETEIQDNEEGSPKMPHKPFFRRLSFKVLRKSKDLFHKQHSDDVDIAHNKTKLAKIVVECRKEGIVNYSTPETLDQPSGPPRWERCRLQLVKATGGYMLEFYSPPKNPKPRSGVFCALITEARETTALEMPDHENTFVLKASNNLEFVIEAHDTDDMRSWLATIRYCMRSGPGGSDTGQGHDHMKEYHHHSDAPDLPPRHPGRGGDRLSSSSNFEICPSSLDPMSSLENDIGQTLKSELWFHGTLGRSEAAQQVLHDGAAGHGRFLVRQSETRTGEFVLTFNFQGRAKHLRMTINEQGQCRVQHFWFQSIYEMLEHFRSQPIPLESGGNSDVTLTDYILNPNARQQHQSSMGRSTSGPMPSSTSQPAVTNGHDRRVPPIPEVRQVQSYNGSVRTQETSIEQIQAEASSRAVDNQYSFV
ncbi:SH2B adapter-like protein Lnk isoform X1 [Leptinotarsa decemlineata]|uniref:SH2B adapter-like protein Lnk isoform X1 n=1 Tax=Leptinotarsa decemlineata TaxID=7539 RepID=UPI000C251CE1|nr:SH2B adapter protein 2 isoform X1 [Leptinotarsa decemlineata]